MNRDNQRITTAGICFKENKVLIGKRIDKGAIASKWEFPGGKNRWGETVEDQKKDGFEVFGEVELLIKDDTFAINKVNTISKFSFVIENSKDQELEIFENKLKITSKESNDSTLLRIADEDISYPLIVRNVRSDDTLITDGGRIELNKFFSNWKIKERDRKKVIVLEDKTGLIAVFAKHLGGRDRIAKRVKTPLVGKTVKIYSIV